MAYDLLLRKLQKKDPAANRESVVRKVNSIRSTFRKEFKKVVFSKTSGQAADSVYQPSLWYYNDLMFLQDTEAQRPSVSNIEVSEELFPDVDLVQIF